jgi:methanogenic corrinoid protein MtbC1
MKTVVAGALGECVYVAGITNFLPLAEQAGRRTVFLGPAISIDQYVEATRREKTDLIGVSYRLTSETGERGVNRRAFASPVERLVRHYS